MISPDQVAVLRAPDKVRGMVSGSVVYSVSVSALTFTRACELAVEGAMPADVTWYTAGSTTARVELHTSRPEFFVELEWRIEDARRPR